MLLMLASPLMLLQVVRVSAQPPPFIANAFVTLTLGSSVVKGTSPWSISLVPANSTILGMGPTPPTADIVWFGEYEYLSTYGPPYPAPWNGTTPTPNPGMVPLFGPGVPRIAGPFGATWYSVIIGPVTIAGVQVTVNKTVRLPLSGVLARLGYVQLDYQIIPKATIPELWLYYSIHYDDTPGPHCPNCDTTRVYSYYNYSNGVWQQFSYESVPRMPPPAPMLTPPGGGILVDTEGSGAGYMGSWNWSYNTPPGPDWIPASTFNVWRYCGYWNRTLWPDWYGWPVTDWYIDPADGKNKTLPVCNGALSVNLTSVSPAGVRCNQLYIGGIFYDTGYTLEPPIPPVPLTACFEFKDQWFTPQMIVNESEHSVRRICPIAGRPVTFDASRSFDLNQTHTIIAYEWDFGDGTSPINTTTPIIEHTYPDLGYNYEVNVTLTAYCDAGEAAHARGRMIIAPRPVGSDIVVPVDKFGLLAPYIGLASTILIATVVTAVYAKRVKRRKEKQYEHG